MTFPLAAAMLAALPATGSRAAAAETPSQADRVEVGQEAPGFSLASSSGETHSLSDLRGEKNLVLIFFRGNW